MLAQVWYRVANVYRYPKVWILLYKLKYFHTICQNIPLSIWKMSSKRPLSGYWFFNIEKYLKWVWYLARSKVKNGGTFRSALYVRILSCTYVGSKLPFYKGSSTRAEYLSSGPVHFEREFSFGILITALWPL